MNFFLQYAPRVYTSVVLSIGSALVLFYKARNVLWKASKKNLSLSGGEIKILLIYSKQHFNPSGNSSSHLSFSGTAYWAEYFYELFQKIGNISYVDYNEVELIRTNAGKYNIVAGLSSSGFNLAAKVNPEAYKILIAVNCHPHYRNKIIKQESEYFSKPPTELLNPFKALKSVSVADKIVLTGNSSVKETYLSHGVNEKDIILLAGAADPHRFPSAGHKRQAIRIVYAGPPTLRKGLFRFLDALSIEKIDTNPFVLVLYNVSSESEQEEIKLFIKKKKIEIKVEVHQWLDHKQLLDLFHKSSIAILASHEEGMVFSVLEAISCGCVPLASRWCGIELPNKNQINDVTDYIEVMNKLESLVNNIESELKGVHAISAEIISRKRSTQARLDAFIKDLAR